MTGEKVTCSIPVWASEMVFLWLGLDKRSSIIQEIWFYSSMLFIIKGYCFYLCRQNIKIVKLKRVRKCQKLAQEYFLSYVLAICNVDAFVKIPLVTRFNQTTTTLLNNLYFDYSSPHTRLRLDMWLVTWPLTILHSSLTLLAFLHVFLTAAIDKPGGNRKRSINKLGQ